ncbi:MAG: cyclic nucleotide-binding domain-containing protein [Chitinophagaceae bacterium]
MQQIRQYFENMVPFSDKDWAIFFSKLQRVEVPGKTLLLKTGQKEQYLSFIEQGIVRFFIPKEENDVTFSFSFSNTFVSAYDSFLTQSPSTYDVETIADTILWRVTWQHLQEIYKESDMGQLIGRYAAEDIFLKKAKRELQLLTQTAEELYLHLLTEQPHLVQQIPLKYLASYIGITPQALSRIRKRIS